MRLRNLSYFIQEAVATLRQDRRLHVTALTMIGMSLLILSAFLLVVWNMRLLLQEFGSQLNVIVFLEDDIPSQHQQTIAAHLQDFVGEETIQYVSKEQAWQDLTTWFPEGKYIIDGLTHNPLPASYMAPIASHVQGSTAVRNLVQRLSRLPGVEEVEYGAKWHQGFRTVLYVGQLLSFGGGVLLCLGVIFIIANTIRLTIYMRLAEIEIMQLVGATEGFIKGPFLCSGMIQGLLGTALALSILFGLYRLLVQRLGDLLSMTFGLRPLVFLPLPLIGTLLVGGLCLGYIGSAFTLNRILRTLETVP